ncbi:MULTISPECIES: hypothetical protein [Amniculibacterium]|uniref:hypothetical protein n=1 Tax=Amniculibacterium TaxID=2715289 RepID=UPI0013DDD536|nr:MULTISPECIES: hypothetical protein [Amniculibacterium]
MKKNVFFEGLCRLSAVFVEYFLFYMEFDFWVMTMCAILKKMKQSKPRHPSPGGSGILL